MTRHFLPLGVAGLALVLGTGACQRVKAVRLPSPEPGLPQDLRLTPEASAQAQALAHFAWGLKAELEAQWPTQAVPPARAPWFSAPGLVPPSAVPPFAPPFVPPPVVGPLVAREPAALAHFRMAVELQPANAELLGLYLSLLSRQGGAAETQAELERLIARHPASPPLALALAEALDARGEPAAAIQRLRQAAVANGWRDADLAGELYRRLVDAERLGEAGEILAAARGPGGLATHSGLLTLAADYHWRRQDPGASRWGTAWWHRRQALALMRQAEERFLAAAPPFTEGTATEAVLLSDLLREAQEEGRAETLLLTALKLFAGATREVDFALLNLYADQGRPEMAKVLLGPLEEELRGELAQWTRGGGRRDAATTEQLFQDLDELAALAQRLEQDDLALRLSLQALRLRPDNWELRLRSGELLLAKGQADQALGMARAIRLAVPGKFWLMSRALAHQGHRQEAVRQAEKAAAAARDLEQPAFFTVDYYLGYSFMLEQVGRGADSLAAAEEALRLDPRSSDAANTVGYILADLNRDLPRAETLIRQALATQPDEPALLDSLAWVLYRRGAFPEAWIQISRALEKLGEQEDAVLFEHAGEIAAALGRREEALRWWKRALASGPADAAAVRAKIERLQLPVSAP